MAYEPIHIMPTREGEWSVTPPGHGSVNVYPTRGLAVARAWELASGQPTAEVVVHETNGIISSRLTIHNAAPVMAMRDVYEDAEDEALYREAERLLPSREQIRELMARLPVSTIDYSQEDDELPC